MAQAGKSVGGGERTRNKTKLSRDKKESSGKSEDSDQPKISHRSRKTLTAEQKVLLKEAFDDLCCPQPDSESRISEWLEVNTRKDKDLKNKDIKSWNDKYASSYPELKRFNAAHFLQGLHAQDFKPEVAMQYANSLIVRQTAFKSIESFDAAQAVIKRISKGDAHKPEKLLKSVSGLPNGQAQRENLHKAITDVGLKSPVIKELLNTALNVMDPEFDPDVDQVRFAHEVKSMTLALERLGKPAKSGSSVRNSAPVGTFSVNELNELAKQARNVTLPANLPRQRSSEKTQAESPTPSPRKEVHRENKSVGRSKSKSRTDLESELSPDRARRKESQRDESPGKRTRDDSPVKKRPDDSKSPLANRSVEAPVISSTAGATATTTTTTTSPQAGGARHARQASNQNAAVLGSLKQKLGEKNQNQSQ